MNTPPHTPPRTPPSTPASTPARSLILAAQVVDGEGVNAAPGAVLLEGDRILAAGSPQAVGSPVGAARLELPDSIVIPALANAHCHLDLSHIGPQPFPGDFVSWVETIRSRRAPTPVDIAASVRLGITLSRAGGTAMIGDIAGVGSLVPTETLRAQSHEGLIGVSFMEVFGQGLSQERAIAAMRRAVELCPEWSHDIRFGLQPHAPYSCGLDVYRTAVQLNRPLATHLAETPQELEFIRTATGPLADMLRRIGVWDPTIAGSGLHPVDHLAEVLSGAPFIAAHVNHIEDAHLAMLARWPITVAYCPRASAYFGHRHRYREMLEMGINVALGTDSLICLDTPDRISVLDDMRLLHRRDGTDPKLLLKMATTAGAAALGFDPSFLALSPGRIAGLLAISVDRSSPVEPLRQALETNRAPQWLAGPFRIGHDPHDPYDRS